MADNIPAPYAIKIAPATQSENTGNRVFTWEYLYGISCSFKVRVSKLDYSYNPVELGEWTTTTEKSFTLTGDIQWTSGQFIGEDILYRLEIVAFGGSLLDLESEVHTEYTTLTNTYRHFLGSSELAGLTHNNLNWVVGGEPISGVDAGSASTVHLRMSECGRRYASTVGDVNIDGQQVNNDGTLNRLQKQILANDIFIYERLSADSLKLEQMFDAPKSALCSGTVSTAVVYPNLSTPNGGDDNTFNPKTVSNSLFSNVDNWKKSFLNLFSVDSRILVSDPVPASVNYLQWVVMPGLSGNIDIELVGDFVTGGYYDVEYEVYQRPIYLNYNGGYTESSFVKKLGTEVTFYRPNENIPATSIGIPCGVYWSPKTTGGRGWRGWLWYLYSGFFSTSQGKYSGAFGIHHEGVSSNKITIKCDIRGYAWRQNGATFTGDPHPAPGVSLIKLTVKRIPYGQ